MKKVLLFVSILIIGLFSIAGCGWNKYNAELYSHAEKWMSKEFLRENRVNGYYDNEDYVEGESDLRDRLIYERNLSTSLTFIITEQEEFENICPKCPSTVDFGREMVILYILSNSSPRDYYLNKIVLEDQTLTIYYKIQKGDLLDSVMLYQRCFMVKLKQVEFEEVKFIYKR